MRRNGDSSDIPLEDRWSVMQGELEGKPLFVRLNKAAANLAGKTLRFRVGVAVPFNKPNKHGLPSPADSAALDEIEDRLTGVLEENGQCVLVLVLTTGGMREFVLYCGDAKLTQQRLEALQASVTSHEVQCIIEDDPDWDVYKDYASPGAP